MENKIIVLVGLPGSGKSHLAEKIQDEIGNAVILSTDEYRREKFGDEKILGNSDAIFRSLYDVAVTHLKNGKNVIFDATMLSYKRRIQMNKYIHANIPDCKIWAVVVATQFSICVDRDARRERSVGRSVIASMRKIFTCPSIYEGYERVDFSYTYRPVEYELDALFTRMMAFNQDNFHHEHTLGEHSMMVAQALTHRPDLTVAGLLHDIGKEHTKQFVDSKGNPTEYAHYYSHENVSAYESMFYALNFLTDGYGEYVNPFVMCDDGGYAQFRINPAHALAVSNICTIIQYHMRPHGFKSDKAIQKFKELVGEDMFESVMTLHEADRNAH